MAFDSARGRTVLFAGDAFDQDLQDTWEWDGANWVQLAAGGPPARHYPGLAYDSGNAVTVLFGGFRRAFSPPAAGDTWLWNGSTWQPASPPVSPSARWDHAMAYDGANVVLFGGYPDLSDTWLWNGSTWQPASPANHPSGRQLHAVAYDGARGNVVLFGGGLTGASPVYGDTWIWDGVNWTLAANAGPPARMAHAMAYDSASQKVVLFGGWNGTQFLSDTWEWNGTTWNQVAASGPAGRRGHAMSGSSGLCPVVLFGGYVGPTTPSGETWVYGGGCTGCLGVTGACCLPGGTCLDNVTPIECASQGGQFQGAGTSCGAPCPLPSGIPTVSEWGLIVLTLLLLTAGTLVVGRQRRRAVPA